MTAALGPGAWLLAMLDLPPSDVRAGRTYMVAGIVGAAPCDTCGCPHPCVTLMGVPTPPGYCGFCPSSFRPWDGPEEPKRCKAEAIDDGLTAARAATDDAFDDLERLAAANSDPNPRRTTQ